MRAKISKRSLIYLAAAGVYGLAPLSLKFLYKALLRALGSVLPTASSLVSEEPELYFESDMIDPISQNPWCFPNTVLNLKKVLELKYINYGDSIKMIGILDEMLGLSQIQD